MNSNEKFTHDRFDALMNETFEKLKKLSELKGGEYAGDVDRLANFRRNAAAMGTHMELIWGVYAAKHWDAIMQYVQDRVTGKTRERMEGIDGRIDDLMLYLMLFKAIVSENGHTMASGVASTKPDANEWIKYNPELPPPTGRVDVIWYIGGIQNNLDPSVLNWSRIHFWRPHHA